MPSRSQELEMATYDQHTHPLLADTPSSRSGSPERHRRRNSLHQMSRYKKPLFCLSLPLVLIGLYALLHPYLGSLPSIPRIGGKLGIGQEIPVSPGFIPGTECTCGATPEGERLCRIYGEEGLKRSRLYEGMGARVRRVLQRGRDGEKLRVGVLGGSVSACHGVHPSLDFPQGDPDGPACYTTLVRQWFQDTFPYSSAELLNGAIGGMDSSYYAFCGTHHISPDVDLIILEFDVNDQADLIYQAYFDQLLRVLLEFPSQPAVIVLGAWSPQVAIDQGYGDPQIVHLPISHYYDIAYISMKRTLFNTYLRFPKSTAATFYQHDKLHPNARGHRVLADLLISYLESELCLVTTYGLPVSPSASETIATTSTFDDLVEAPFALDTPHMTDPLTPPPGWEITFDPAPLKAITEESRQFLLSPPYSLPLIPLYTPLRDVLDPMTDPTNGDNLLGLRQPKMFCADANDRYNPLTPLPSKEGEEGWREFVWNGEKHFWVSEKVGSRISVDIKVNAGRVAVYYFRSQLYNLGNAKCWVDDNEKGAIELTGYWEKGYNVAVVEYIDEKVTPGDHFVTCEILRNTSHPHNPNAHHFRIVAVMAT